MVQLFKIEQDRNPVYLIEKISNEFKHKTRLATGNGIRGTEKVKSDERNKLFIPRATKQWNIKVFGEPEAIQEGTKSLCKKKCKHYVNFNY